MTNLRTATDKKAYQALIKARTVLIVSQPFFGCLTLHVELVEKTEPGLFNTMAVDGTHLFYWPEFVHKLTEPELCGVLAHEVMHLALAHMVRRQNRHPLIWNMAGDYVINASLLKAGISLPKGCLQDSQYDNMSSEEVYERIKQEVEKQLKQMQGQGGKGGKDKKSQGQGEGLNGMGNDPGGCGGVMDAAGPGDKHKQDEVAREWDATVRMAVNVARRANAGTTPGYLERLVKQLQEPRVSWREMTRQFIDQSMSKDYSWSRPNRRYVSQDMILPGFVPDALHHMVFVVDTSGSIDEKMLQAMASEIGGALDDGVADKITVLYADTKVQHVDEFVMGDMIQCKIHGGGGTAFADSFKWISNNAPDAQCIVYLTDMMTSEWGEDIGIPCLWAAYLPLAHLASIKPPFGSVIAVDTSE